MKKIYLISALLFWFSFFSCEEPIVIEETDINPLSSSADYEFKKKFGIALAKGLSENQELRKFIRNQSLKMFNKDYDILYHFVKHQIVSDGKTFREVLSEYFESDYELMQIESRLPLLTIFVPELPEQSFSPHKWDVSDPEQIPLVGLRINSMNGVPILNKMGDEFVLPANYIPAFPVVVIKDNERINVVKSTTNSSRGKLITSDMFEYEFVNDAFDNINKSNSGYNSARITPIMDQKIIDATNMGIEWHRDYIYYDLTPTNPKGPFSYDFQEYITTFRLLSEDGFYKITDQGDPKIKVGVNNSGWTDGFYEIRINALVNGKSTKPDINPAFSVRGGDLFSVEYKKIPFKECFFCKKKYMYFIKEIKPKTYYPPNVPLIKWDLDSYSNAMVIKISEFDISETHIIKQSVSGEFATNFGIEGGELKKIGLKFGTSLKETQTQEHTITYTLDSDDLGETTVYFADKIIVDKLTPIFPVYITQEYFTGFVAIGVEPRRVQ